ncbi:MAG: arylesterase [Ectothiorhodospiraceae bacterium]
MVLLLFLATGPGLAGERTVLVLGDSLSAAYGMDRDEGWVARLDERLQQQEPAWRAVNASTSGDTTGSGLSRLPGALERHDPAIVIIALGGNDGLRGTSPATIQRNLNQMVTAVREHGARVLLAGVRIPPNYGSSYIRLFRQVYTDVAAERDVALVPRLLDDVADDDSLMKDDGIHPRATAQPVILDNVWSELRPMLQE